MTRYITALLVVLAATGVEAQTYAQVLQAALGETNIRMVASQPELRGIETDLLLIVKAYKRTMRQTDDRVLPYALHAPELLMPEQHEPRRSAINHKPLIILPAPPKGSISIRAGPAGAFHTSEHIL